MVVVLVSRNDASRTAVANQDLISSSITSTKCPARYQSPRSAALALLARSSIVIALGDYNSLASGRLDTVVALVESLVRHDAVNVCCQLRLGSTTHQ